MQTVCPKEETYFPGLQYSQVVEESVFEIVPNRQPTHDEAPVEKQNR